MAVGLSLGRIIDEIGSTDFFYAFFSTVSGRLEPEGWGSRFPIIMEKLYRGDLAQEDAGAALAEINRIVDELSHHSSNQIIWDYGDRSKMPPWGDKISSDITSLANYFVTSTGRDLIEVIKEVLIELKERGGTLRVVNV